MWALGIFVMVVLDIIWLNTMKGFYGKRVLNVQGTPLEVKWIPAILTYVLMFVGFVFYVYPIAKRDIGRNPWLTAMRYGGLFGLFVYGVYNLTSLSIYKGYDWIAATVDTFWGFTLFTLVTYVSLIKF